MFVSYYAKIPIQAFRCSVYHRYIRFCLLSIYYQYSVYVYLLSVYYRLLSVYTIAYRYSGTYSQVHRFNWCHFSASRNAAQSGNCFLIETVKILNFNLGEKLSKRGNFKCFHRIPHQKTHKITKGIFFTA